VQGYLVARPVPANELGVVLAEMPQRMGDVWPRAAGRRGEAQEPPIVSFLRPRSN